VKQLLIALAHPRINDQSFVLHLLMYLSFSAGVVRTSHPCWTASLSPQHRQTTPPLTDLEYAFELLLFHIFSHVVFNEQLDLINFVLIKHGIWKHRADPHPSCQPPSHPATQLPWSLPPLPYREKLIADDVTEFMQLHPRFPSSSSVQIHHQRNENPKKDL
jgi:hypothetical protein